MEDADSMLIKSLIKLGVQIKEDIAIASFTPDDLINICIQYLALSGLQSFEISAIKTVKSAFRQAGKIQDHFQAQGLKVDIQSIMNPNINDSKRLIVNMLSKLSQSNKKETRAKEMTFEERVAEEKNQLKQDAMNQFFIDWVNPTLLNHPNVEQRYLKLHVLNIIKSQPIIQQLGNKGVRKHLYNSLARVMDYYEYKQQLLKDVQPKQESLQRLQLIKKMRRSDDPDAVFEQFRGQLGDEQEREEWEDLQKGNKQVKKAIKQLKEQDKEEQENRQQKEEQNQGLYNLEIQFQEEVKTVEETQNKVDDTKQELQNNIEELSKQIQEQQRQLNEIQRQKQTYEEQHQKLLDEYQNLIEYNKTDQDKLENQHLILQQVENKTTNNDSEIAKLEEEMEEIKRQWETQRFEMKTDIDNLQSQVNERKMKVDQLKDKLKRLQEENQMIRNQGRINLEKKEQLMLELQQMPKEVARGTYIRKINDLRNNLNKQKEEFNKVALEVQELEKELDFQNNTINRYYIEFENMINQDPKKNEQIAKYIYKQYQDYRQSYKQSSDVIREIGTKRITVYEAEILMEELNMKGYKKNVEKLKSDLQEIRSENSKLQSQQQK